jgi:hypothetical protein
MVKFTILETNLLRVCDFEIGNGWISDFAGKTK